MRILVCRWTQTEKAYLAPQRSEVIGTASGICESMRMLYQNGDCLCALAIHIICFNAFFRFHALESNPYANRE